MNAIKKIGTICVLVGALAGCRYDRQNELEAKWNYALSRGSKPYTVRVSERDINEYLDTNFNGGYDLTRTSDKKFYSEIPETSQEQLRE